MSVGQYIIDRINYRLGGYQNSVSYLALLDFANEAAQELWIILKSLREDYFLQFSQSTDSTASYYFPPLTTNTREYALPSDFREIRWIEPTSTGYQDLVFVYCKPVDPNFRGQRQAANQQPAGTYNQSTYLYTIIGEQTFSLAQYLSVNVNVTLWYIRGIPRFEVSDSIPDLLEPYLSKIVDYAVTRAMATNQDVAQFQVWKSMWRDDCISIAQGASERNASDPTFVQDFGSDGGWC